MEKSLWRQDPNLTHFPENAIKLLSCDIFDTLVFRTTATPHDLFTRVGREARSRKLFKNEIAPEEFKQLRIFAEKEARSRKYRREGSWEVNIFEIYDQIPDAIGAKDSLPPLELEIEKECSYLNPSVESLLHHCHSRGIPVVLLSDMYLLPAQLEDLLTAIGFDYGIPDAVIVSNQYGVNKWDRGLYRVLLEKYSRLEPGSILHIGDTYGADVQNAQTCGLRTLYYGIREKNGAAFEMEYSRGKTFIPELWSLRKLAGSLANESEEEKKFWFEFGATIIGPFLGIFAEWAVDAALARGIKRIYPLMREGGITAAFIQNSLDARQIRDIVVKPLYISRRAVFLPSLSEINEETIKNEIAYQKVNSIFTRFKIENIFKEYGDWIVRPDDDPLPESGKNLFTMIRDYLCGPEIRKRLMETSEWERQILLRYLTEEYEMDRGAFLTLDIGYYGTMQTAVTRILRRAGCSGDGFHLVMIGFNELIAKLLAGIDIKGFINEAEFGGRILNFNNWMPGIIEGLMMESIGSTLGYQETSSGRVEPVLEEVQNQYADDLAKFYCRQGMFAFQSLFLKLLRRKPELKETLYDQKNRLLEIILRFMECPTSTEARYLGNLDHEDVYGGERLKPLCPPELIARVKKVGPEVFSRIKIGSNLWMAGIVETAFPNYHKTLLLRQDYPDESSTIPAKLAKLLSARKTARVIIYGAGEIGRELARLLKPLPIEVACIVDSNKELWGATIDGIRVCSLAEALTLKTPTVVIASRAFIWEIRQVLENKCYEDKLDLDILDYRMNCDQ